jgi:splicing factor 3B subunit 3
MLAAVEKQKLVYVMNRDPTNNKLTISSPLESNKSNVVVFSLAAVDVGYENPLFAAIEVDATPAVNSEVVDAELLEKSVTFYEVDLGLNHVTRKWSEPVMRSANLVLPVPGGEDGPGGVLVCGEGSFEWHRMGFTPVNAVLPKRFDPLSSIPKRGIIATTGAVVRAKGGFFMLLQTEEGDLFKVSIAIANDKVTRLDVSYFDTVPVATTIQVFKSGFLFVGSEWMNHRLYQIQSLGSAQASNDTFTPHDLTNLALVDQLENYSEITDGRVLNLGEEIPQIYASRGRAQNSSFEIMRPGVHVTEVAASELPDEPTGVWTLKNALGDVQDAYIVVSFADSTVVLQVGETVEEATDTGLLTNVPSILISQLSDDSILQVYPGGMRQIRPNRQINEWRVPNGTNIRCATSNTRQLALALDTKPMIVYFEADLTNILLERRMAEVPETVFSLALGPVPEGRQRSRFLAVGSADLTVRILTCDPEECLEPLSVQALAAIPRSLLITDLGHEETLLLLSSGALVLDVGLENGVCARLRLDGTTGALTDARSRYLGTAPVMLSRGKSEATGSVILALSSRPWISYIQHGQAHMLPLTLPPLSAAAPFASQQCPAGIVAVSGTTLRIVMVESVEERLTRHRVPLDHTPRKIAHHSSASTTLFAIIESDHRGYLPSEREAIQEHGGDGEVAHLGFKGRWASCVRLVNPGTGETSAVHRFGENEALTCLSFITFHDRLEELYLAVGVAKDMSITPRNASSCAVLLFMVDITGGTMRLTHCTPVDAIVSYMAPLGGRLLCSVGSALRLYDIGKRQLLRKCEVRLPTYATTISSQGWRVFVGDGQASVLLFQYNSADNRFQLVADDTQQRPITALQIIDYDTVVVADRFGSISILRLPASVAEDLENEVTAGSVAAKREHLFGAPFKLERIAEFYIGDTVTSISKTNLVYGSRDVLLYTTILGGVGVLVPFTYRSEALIMQNLELAIRQEPSLVGRDHLIYRSYYAPVKGVIDGDLCETYQGLTGDRMHFVATQVDLTPREVARKIEDLRVTAGV